MQQAYKGLFHDCTSAQYQISTLKSSLDALTYRFQDMQNNITSLYQHNYLFQQVVEQLKSFQLQLHQSVMSINTGHADLLIKAEEMKKLITDFETVARDPVITRIMEDIRDFSDQIEDVLREG